MDCLNQGRLKSSKIKDMFMSAVDALPPLRPITPATRRAVTLTIIEHSGHDVAAARELVAMLGLREES